MDHKILVRRLFAAWLVLLAAQSPSCATLEDVDPDFCGNRVVEVGEDCDGNPENGICGARGTDHECRYVWDKDKTDCPGDEYVASDDKRCRRPAFTYEFLGPPLLLPGRNPQVGDFDGDARMEIGLATTDPVTYAPRFSIFSLTSGTPTELVTQPTSSVAAFADLSGDQLADVAIGIDGFQEKGSSDPEGACGTINFSGAASGLAVYRSRVSALDTKFYANDDFPGTDVRFAALPAWLAGCLGEVDLAPIGALYNDGGAIQLCDVDMGCPPLGLGVPLPGITTTRGISVDFSESHLVFAVAGQTGVLYLGRANHIGLFPPALESFLTLPLQGDAIVVGGARLVDVTGDGNRDLVVLGRTLTTLSIYVLPDAGGSWSGADELRPWAVVKTIAPGSFLDTKSVVVGELNGDGVPDWVIGREILLSRGFALSDPGTTRVPTVDAYYRRFPWLRRGALAIGDINGDGFDDVASQALPSEGLSQGAVQILLGGELLPFVAIDLEATGLMSHAEIADFDGDGAGDIMAAFSNSSEPAGARSCDSLDSLAVSYGRVGSSPEPLQFVGALPAVVQIASGRFAASNDGFGDFAISATCLSGLPPTPAAKTATVQGNSLRLVNNPLSFVIEDEGVNPFPPRAVFTKDLVAHDRDALDPQGIRIAHPDAVVVGLDYDVGRSRAFVLPAWGDAEIDADLRRELVLPEAFAADYGGAYLGYTADIELAGTPTHLLVATTHYGYNSDTGSADSFMAGFVVQRMGDDDVESIATFDLELPYVEPSQEIPSFVRAVATDLNEDAALDFVVVYGVSSDGDAAALVSSLVAILSNDSGGYDAPIPIDGFADFRDGVFVTAADAPVDVIMTDGGPVVAGRQFLYTVDLKTKLAMVLAAIEGTLEARAAVVVDVNGDLLDDILVFDGIYGYVLEHQPLHP